MSDRASLPDFELPSSGSPRFPLSALQAHPFQQPTFPRQPLSHGPEEACRLPKSYRCSPFHNHVPH